MFNVHQQNINDSSSIFSMRFLGEIETDNLTVSNIEIIVLNFTVSKQGFHEIVSFF